MRGRARPVRAGVVPPAQAQDGNGDFVVHRLDQAALVRFGWARGNDTEAGRGGQTGLPAWPPAALPGIPAVPAGTPAIVPAGSRLRPRRLGHDVVDADLAQRRPELGLPVLRERGRATPAGFRGSLLPPGRADNGDRPPGIDDPAHETRREIGLVIGVGPHAE